jgi:hypothetical protein
LANIDDRVRGVQLNAPTTDNNDGPTNAALTLRGRLREMPPLNTTGLWSAQVEAVNNLERSLADGSGR